MRDDDESEGIGRVKLNGIGSAEIARIAGVSRSTVSRVINRYPNVPEKTRIKVMKVIEEHNYVPNISAQVLAGKKTRILGLFLFADSQISSDVLTNYIISSVIEAATERDYQVLTNLIRRSSPAAAGVGKVKELFYQKRIDGGIFIGGANREPFIEELVADGFMVGLIDHELSDRQEPNRIIMNFDNVALGEAAVDYLAGLGHAEIGVVNGDMRRYAGPAKYEGFVSGMRKHGLAIRPEWVLPGDFSEQGGYAAARLLLKSAERLPTALFAANDSMAFGVIRALREHGLNVPGHMSVVGIDDHMLSSYCKPALTTFRVEIHEMMRRLTQALIQSIERGGEQLVRMQMDFRLIERESCRARGRTAARAADNGGHRIGG